MRGSLRFSLSSSSNENLKNAVNDFDKALELSYSRPSLTLLSYLAHGYQEMKIYSNSIKYYTMELDSAKDKGDVLFHRALDLLSIDYKYFDVLLKKKQQYGNFQYLSQP